MQRRVEDMSRKTMKPLVLISVLVAILIIVSFYGGKTYQNLTQQRVAEPVSPTFGTIDDGILFFGDSYSFGVGSSRKHERWTSQLASKMHFTEINAAIPGEGYQRRPASCESRRCPYFLESLQNFATVDANLVMLSGGQNDLSRMRTDPEAVEQAVEKTLIYLKTEYSGSEIVVVGPTTPREFHKEAVKLDNILDKQSQIHSIEYLSLSPIWARLWKHMIGDGQHVNDAGHDIITEFIFAAVGREKAYRNE